MKLLAAALVLTEAKEAPPPEQKKYKGCFIDQAAPNRLLPHLLNTRSASVDYCLKYCYDLDYRYAGVQAWDWCLCGNDISKGVKAPETDCNMSCAGDSSQTCGAGWRMNVYELNERPFVCKAPTYEGTTKAFTTENTYNYMVNGPILSNQRNIMEGVKFNVDATHEKWPEGGTDIHISLSKVNPIDKDNSYEIALGGWGGVKSVIRKFHQQRPPLVEVEHSREDFIKWQCNFELKMTRKTLGIYDSQGNVIMETDDFDYKDYKYLYISTGFGTKASWNINANYDSFNYDKDPAEALGKVQTRLASFLEDNLSGHKNWLKKMNKKVDKIAKRMLTHHEKLAKKCDTFGPTEDDSDTERYDANNPCKAAVQLPKAFMKWSNVYNAKCKGDNKAAYPQRIQKDFDSIRDKITKKLKVC